jgi:hypothetical protein
MAKALSRICFFMVESLEPQGPPRYWPDLDAGLARL